MKRGGYFGPPCHEHVQNMGMISVYSLVSVFVRSPLTTIPESSGRHEGRERQRPRQRPAETRRDQLLRSAVDRKKLSTYWIDRAVCKHAPAAVYGGSCRTASLGRLYLEFFIRLFISLISTLTVPCRVNPFFVWGEQLLFVLVLSKQNNPSMELSHMPW